MESQQSLLADIKLIQKEFDNFIYLLVTMWKYQSVSAIPIQSETTQVIRNDRLLARIQSEIKATKSSDNGSLQDRNLVNNVKMTWVSCIQ